MKEQISKSLDEISANLVLRIVNECKSYTRETVKTQLQRNKLNVSFDESKISSSKISSGSGSDISI